MILNEFIKETQKNQMIAELLKHYKVDSVRWRYKSIKDHAHYNVDKGILELSSKYRKLKDSQMKDFLINAGVRDFSDDSKAMEDAIGKSLMIAFISDEYISVNKDNQEPVIRTTVKYRWSSKENGKCTYNSDMNQTLSDKDMQEFQKRHKEWTSANNDIQNNPENDNLPF